MRDRIRIILAYMMSVLALSSCEFGANAVDGSSIELEEGMTFVYDNHIPFSFRSSVELGETIDIRLLSMEATIGGRDNVLGFVSSADGELIFTDVRDGQVWYYFTANQDFVRPLHRTGEWIRLPGDGDDPVFATIEDSVGQDFEFPVPIKREIAVRPAGQFKFYVDGFYFDARKIKVTSTYHQGHGGGFENEGQDEQEITVIDRLGVIAEKITREGSGFETTHFIMTEIER